LAWRFTVLLYRHRRLAVGELESIRQIARRIVEEYRQKRLIDPRVFLSETPADVLGAIEIMNEPRFDGIDREFLRNMGIEA
jgi:hypothetical protein